ncbi:hypothetical protein D3C84_757950 [compost metagenome]
MVGAEYVAPGQPVENDHFAVLDKTPALGDGLLVCAEHAVGIDHRLGRASRTGGQQIAGRSLAVYLGKRRHHRRAFRLVQHRQGQGIGDFLSVARRDHRAVRLDQLDRPAIGITIVDKNQRRLEHLDNRLEFAAPTAGISRIGHRYGGDRNAHMHCRQGQQRLVNIVFREHQHRPPWRGAQFQQALSQGTHSLANFLVGQGEPGTITSLGQVRPLWCVLCPLFKPLSDAPCIGLQGLRRRQDKAAVGAGLVEHVSWRQAGRIIEEVVHCTPS